MPNRDLFIFINVFFGVLIHIIPDTLHYARSYVKRVCLPYYLQEIGQAARTVITKFLVVE